MKTYHKKNNSGFSLIEILVTIGLFAMVMTISSAIFINVNNLEQQTANMARLQNEGRYILEKMGKEIRGRELDYTAMAKFINSNKPNETSALVFKTDEYGEVYKLAYDSATSSIVITTLVNAVSQSANLNSSEVAVEQFKFILTPADAPNDANPNVQPRVTIMMVIKNKNVPEKYRKTLTLQTTISSKIYR